MHKSPNAEVYRRLNRLLLFRRLRTASFFLGMFILIFSGVTLISPDFRALLRNDRLGPPEETTGIVVRMDVPESETYSPAVPVVRLDDGRRVRAPNPLRFPLLKGDRVIVEERTYVKSGYKKFRVIRPVPDDE